MDCLQHSKPWTIFSIQDHDLSLVLRTDGFQGQWDCPLLHFYHLVVGMQTVSYLFRGRAGKGVGSPKPDPDGNV
jgi:hypothetical protein